MYPGLFYAWDISVWPGPSNRTRGLFTQDAGMGNVGTRMDQSTPVYLSYAFGGLNRTAYSGLPGGMRIWRLLGRFEF